MKPSFTAGIYFDNKIWFSDNSFNAFMNMDVVTGECYFIDSFPNEDINKLLVHRSAIRYGNKLIFTPNQGCNVHIYDTENGSIDCIPICENKHSRYYFSNGFLVDGRIWICPGSIEYPIHIIDIDSKEINRIYLKELCEVSIQMDCLEEEHFFMWILKDNVLMSPVINNGMIVRCDTKTNKISVLDTKIKGIDSIYCTENDLWLCGIGGIYKWEYTENKVVKYLTDELKSDTNLSESYRICGDEKIGVYAFHFCGGKIFKLSGQYFERIQAIDLLKRTLGNMKGYWYDGAEIVDGKIFLFPPYEANIYVIEGDQIKTLFTKCINILELKKFYNGGSVIHEGVINIDDYLSIIQ